MTLTKAERDVVLDLISDVFNDPNYPIVSDERLELLSSARDKIATESMTDYEQFLLDMAQAEEVVEDYERRFGDTRPAVRIDHRTELQRVIRATSVPVEWDQLGEGLIVYPAAREQYVPAAEAEDMQAMAEQNFGPTILHGDV